MDWVCCCQSPKGASVSKHKAKHSASPSSPAAHFSLEKSSVPAAGQATFLLSSCDKDTNTLLRQKQLLH